MTVARPSQHFVLGALLVFASALTWSFGGSLARSLTVTDSWTIVFWRSLFAAGFLIAFMVARDGVAGTIALFRGMGLPGVAVGLLFAIASMAFVVALTHTTVANILLIQAGVPLIAALMAWAFFRERPEVATWIAIAAVIAGIAIMVSDSLGGAGSLIGNALALLIAVSFASATVITRRFAHVRMMPACCFGTLVAAAVASQLAGSFAISTADVVILIAFGAFNLGLGMAFFVTGVRMIPASIAALIGTSEPVLGPLWVWLSHGETPSLRTVIGGAVVLVALIAHILWQIRRQRQETGGGQAV
jgi:drug/metabolite transporter (DMT)-like permease